ncbi:MAG: hypothetical protein NTV46_18115 [Verrucomicrobia bacterium]|nr:hypothetical protein [Verrucomicrobiota bacterium]
MENHPDDPELIRPPITQDLVTICRELNHQGARYIVVGGMAMIIHGFIRATEDIDLLIETTVENERKILDELSHLPKPSRPTAKRMPSTVPFSAKPSKTVANGPSSDADLERRAWSEERG